MIFEWDENKAKINFQRHGISFEEAELAFDDDNAVDALDESHSENETRFNLTGLTERFNICRLYGARRKYHSHHLSA